MERQMAHPLQAKVNATQSLRDLADALNEIDDNDLDIVDLSALPTFGGEMPRDTIDVWSWDAEHVMLVEGESFVVVKRDPEAWYA
jgi:hypothetical protein